MRMWYEMISRRSSRMKMRQPIVSRAMPKNKPSLACREMSEGLVPGILAHTVEPKAAASWRISVRFLRRAVYGTAFLRAGREDPTTGPKFKMSLA